MRRLFLLFALVLAGCSTRPEPAPELSAPQLSGAVVSVAAAEPALKDLPKPPPPPALWKTLRRCFERFADSPDRDLRLGETGDAWAKERTISAEKSRCGRRLIARYDKTRKTWR